jgi:hypothetical protein
MTGETIAQRSGPPRVGGGERLRSAIETHGHRLVPPRPSSEVRIVFADPEDWATLRAAGLVLSQLLQL